MGLVCLLSTKLHHILSINVVMFVEKSLQIDSAILWSDLLPEENATNSMSLVLASRERYQETRDLYVHETGLVPG